jgi:hypothetical protein
MTFVPKLTIATKHYAILALLATVAALPLFLGKPHSA